MLSRTRGAVLHVLLPARGQVKPRFEFLLALDDLPLVGRHSFRPAAPLHRCSAELLRPEERDERENAMGDFYAGIGENRAPLADVKVAATAALTCMMGREAIYRRRSVTWDELGVSV